MNWYNEPRNWRTNNDSITITADAETDFWQITHYGFKRDNGHFYYKELEGDFTAKVTIKGNYKDLYDQAGLMIRINEKNWIKTGIEYVHGVQNLSAVVTRDYSDWSVVQIGDNPAAVYITLLRKNDYVEVQYSFNNKDFKMLRLAYFPPNVKVQIGMMCAAPKGNGFSVLFEDFLVTSL